MENEKQKTWSTRDIYLAATLITLNFYMVGIDYQYEGDRPKAVGYFKFELSDGLRDAERKFWTSQLAIEPRAFITNYRGLMTQVNSVYKSPTSDFSEGK